MPYEYDTRGAAVAANIGNDFDSVSLAGYYYAGDGGLASFYRVTTAPDHPGYFQSADGAYWEIAGPELPVEAFGAKGDCPDVSGYAPTDQSSIISAVTNATNDVQAFQDAFVTASALGVCITYGGGKWYRIAFSASGIFGLVMGNGSSLKRVGMGGLQFDPSQLNESTPSESLDANRTLCGPGINLGDPVTRTRANAGSALSSNIITSGISKSSFVSDIYIEDIVIRCDIRVYWQNLTQFSMYGVNFRFGYNIKLIRPRVYGVPNTGILINSCIDVIIDDPVSEYNGYGGALGSSCNGLALSGCLVVGSPELASRNWRIKNPVTRFNKDEGIQYAMVNQLHIENAQSIGDHDRHIEGDSTYATTQTKASLGQEIPYDVVIHHPIQDGLHILGTGTMVDNHKIQVSDSYYLQSDSTGRYLGITGAGSGGPSIIPEG